MSVINSVLKDLEIRQSRFTPIDLDPVPAPVSERRRRDPRPAFFAGILLLGCAAGAWAYLVQSPAGPPQQPALQIAAPAASDPLPQNPSASSAAIAAPGALAVAEIDDGPVPNQLVGLQMREAGDVLRLEFALRDRAVAFLRERAQSGFSYHLRDVENRIAAPRMRGNRWIRELAILSLDSGVDIRFETVPGIQVETSHGLVDGEPVWAIELRRSTPAPERREDIAVAPAADPPAESGSTANAPAPSPGRPDEVPAASPEPLQGDGQAPVVRLDIKSTDRAAQMRERLAYVVELINSGRAADAEKLLLGLLGDTGDHAARQHLLVLYDREHRGDDAIRLLRDSIEAYPGDALFVNEYARQMFRRGAYLAAIDALSGQATTDAAQQAMIAASYQRLDLHDAAVRHYRLSLAQDETSAKNWVGLGISQEQGAQLADALDSYRRAKQAGGLSAGLQAFVDRRSRALEQVLN